MSGGLSTGAVHVWATDVNAPTAANTFVQQASITPSNGSYSLTVQPGYIYTLTTTTGQGKGTAASPAQSTLPLPYSDTFDSDTAGQQPRYLSQQQGAFEVEPCAGGRSGRVRPAAGGDRADRVGRQRQPLHHRRQPELGQLHRLRRRADAAGGRGAAARPGRHHGAASTPADINDYYLQLSNTGAWSIVRNSTSGTLTTLASGTVTAPGTGTWQHLALTFNGALDQRGDQRHHRRHGHRLLLRLGHGRARHLRLPDRPVRQPVGHPGRLGHADRSRSSRATDTAECVDDNAGSSTNGTKVQMWDCNGSPSSQAWTMASNGTVQINGSCLDITGGSTANGALIEEWTCNGGANQQWLAVNGQLVNPVSGKCLDDPGFNTTEGTQLDLWTCNGGSNQQWSVP